MAEDREYCTFNLAGQTFGIDVLHVQEVIRPQRLTRVPLASSVIRGLMNLRGQIVTVLDLRRRLELPERDDIENSLNVVVQTADGAVSLLVDEVGDVIRVLTADREPPPDTLNGIPAQLISGVYPLADRLLMILEIGPIVNFDPMQTDPPLENHR
ncbi:N/A [soil metagenome]